MADELRSASSIVLEIPKSCFDLFDEFFGQNTGFDPLGS
jgi:hypothetical protein